MGNPKKDQHKTKSDQRSWFERVMGAIRKETTEYVTDIPVVKTVNGALSGAKALDRYLPSMQVMCGSVSDNVAFAARFGAIASTVGIGVCIVSAYQGIQALKLIATHLKNISDEVKVLCTLKAMEVVPVMIHNFISEGLNKDFNDNKSHWFFVYHPDTFWTPSFFELNAKHKLGSRFVGYTDQLDSLFIYLLALRKQIKKEEREALRQRKRRRPIKFHVLIPVHQLTVITEYLQFPDGLGDFVVEGKTYGNQELAWLNVPPWQEKFLDGIGNWEPPSPSAWDEVLDFVGWQEFPRLGELRVLGTLPDNEIEADEGTGYQSSSDTESIHGDDDLLSGDPPPRVNDSLPRKRRKKRRRHASH
ncbi:hypothetical protein BDV23DRAFT_149350 [Aspergillus alliaceus]|uniref:Uncharacterized protein n=1 Tax=Petromyces alliaceus TaxID=209559 RepID=A0A5N7CI15_PETAA|nr:hypothetical protein BDV23DRAFT_149350 [Aspergillus alliaceus]